MTHRMLVNAADCRHAHCYPRAMQVYGDLTKHTDALHQARTNGWTLANDMSLLGTYWGGAQVRGIKVREKDGEQSAKDRLRLLRSTLSKALVEMPRARCGSSPSMVHDRLVEMMAFPSTMEFEEGLAAAQERLARESGT